MKFVCPVCGYVEEFDGDQLPEDFKCPQCGVPGSRFLKQEEGQLEWAAEQDVYKRQIHHIEPNAHLVPRAALGGNLLHAGLKYVLVAVIHLSLIHIWHGRARHAPRRGPALYRAL